MDYGGDFYNKPMPEWLDNNDILMYLTHNKGKTVKWFIKRLKLKSIKNDSY